MRARRALLYMPGDDLHKIKKAIELNVDSICMDLEDGVSIHRKMIARQTIIDALNSLNFGNSEKLVRINRVGSNLGKEDIKLILPAHPDGIVVPKIENGEQLHWVSQQITEFEIKHHLPLGQICLIAIIETTKAILNFTNIYDTRLNALIFGAEDLAGEIGAIRTKAGSEIFYARSAVVLYCSIYGLQPIDMVYMDFKNPEGLLQECITGAQMGYTGKQVIHPDQVKIVQEAFTPNYDIIQSSLLLIEEFNKNQDRGIGAFAINGKLVDAPVIRAAENVIARAKAAGKI